ATMRLQKNRRTKSSASGIRSGNLCTSCATHLHRKSPRGKGGFLSCRKCATVYNPAPWMSGVSHPQIQEPLRGNMSEVREDNSASRVAVYFVFIFLAGAIIETLLASFGK